MLIVVGCWLLILSSIQKGEREQGGGGYYAKSASADVLPLARLYLLKVPHSPQTPSGDHMFKYIVIYAIIKAQNVTEKDKRKSNMQHK